MVPQDMQRRVHPDLARDNPRSSAHLCDEPCRLHPGISESVEHRLEDTRWRRTSRVRHRQDRRAGAAYADPRSPTLNRGSPDLAESWDHPGPRGLNDLVAHAVSDEFYIAAREAGNNRRRHREVVDWG